MDWELLSEEEKVNLMRFGAAALRAWPEIPIKAQEIIVAEATELPHRPPNAMREMRNFIARSSGKNRRPPRRQDD
jgi:hypothetical protein